MSVKEKISRRTRELVPSPTLSIDARAKELVSQGVDVISFAVGEPDFDTPSHIKDEAIHAIRSGFTKYTPSSGILPLRQAIADKLLRENGLSYDPGDILVSCGAKHSIYNAIMAICDDGDEVIIPSPYWVSYPEQVRLAGGKPVFVQCSADNEYKITAEDLRKAITPRTKALILNTPNNPSGAVYTEDDLTAIAEVAVHQDIIVISDEVYEKLVYDGEKHVSIAALSPEIKERTVVVNGVSKAYAMTGWRIGYAAGPRVIIKAMADIQGHMTSNPTSISQKASLQALTGTQEPVNEMLRSFSARRDIMVEGLNEITGFKATKPRGAFYVFVDVKGVLSQRFQTKTAGVVADDTALARFLLEEAKVAVVPGSAFGGPGCLRLSYATSEERIKEGLRRIKEAVEGLG
ncbi:MAG TPA: pyridoxal phosphate-dependent aminotransferase [Clostridia bacterium]|nr:pyridoxal phosphate-dependent aminotransferase [Clostridia bacterium]